MKPFQLPVLIVLVVTAATGRAGEEWYPSKWGAGDEIGALNNVTPERVLEAVKLVRQGKVRSLGIEVHSGVPAFEPRTFQLTVVQPDQAGGATIGPSKSTYNDDLVTGWNGIGTQLDGLGHMGIDHVYYNGNHASEFVSADGLDKLGVEKYPPMVSRGVLLDMAAWYGRDIVPAGTAFNSEEIRAAAEQQGVEIRAGDVVLFHTGWLSLMGNDNERYMQGEPGIGMDGARYLADRNVTAVGADNFAVEVVPHEDEAGTYNVHQIMLARNGIFLLENINTAVLAQDRAYEFLFVLGQPRIRGAVQAIINPVAIY